MKFKRRQFHGTFQAPELEVLDPSLKSERKVEQGPSSDPLKGVRGCRYLRIPDMTWVTQVVRNCHGECEDTFIHNALNCLSVIQNWNKEKVSEWGATSGHSFSLKEMKIIQYNLAPNGHYREKTFEGHSPSYALKTTHWKSYGTFLKSELAAQTPARPVSL